MDLNEDHSSDDEVFYGELCLKEIKHMFIGYQNHRQTIAANELSKEDNTNMSLQLISTHSEPDITVGHYHKSPKTTKAQSNETLSAPPNETDMFSRDFISLDNSFLKLEKNIEQTCNSSSKEEIHKTLDATKIIKKYSLSYQDVEKVKIDSDNEAIENYTETKGFYGPSKNKEELSLNTMCTLVATPEKMERDVKEEFSTPSSVLKFEMSSLTTPSNPSTFKKPSTSSIKKTPCKNNAFRHIASPVAYYIKNSPQVPLIQNVNAKKTLSGLSSIPKLVKNTAIKPSNKENFVLPPVAYRSAKKTKIIDVSNGPKMPQSQWAKKLTKTLQKPAIIKHAHREKQITKPLLRNTEDSFADLSLQQADLSVCTKKAAF